MSEIDKIIAANLRLRAQLVAQDIVLRALIRALPPELRAFANEYGLAECEKFEARSDSSNQIAGARIAEAIVRLFANLPRVDND